MSAILLGIVVVTSVAAAVYVSWPLLVGHGGPEASNDQSESELVLDELLLQKEATYSALKELEFDHAMGNLSGQDYQDLTHRYEDRAVALLKTIDGVAQELDEEGPEDAVEREVAALRRTASGRGRRTGDRGQDDEVEEVVAALRAGRGRSGGSLRVADDIEAEVAALRMARRKPAGGSSSPERSGESTCPACQTQQRNRSAAFCSRCGVSLRTTCPSCHGEVDRDDVFCSGCGATLRVENGEPVAQTVIGGVDA